ncbi:flagellar basal-body MS-ring/collar protein FliF [Ramlibacter tataouinensis]|uniref:flagellar basal-body MS-ring/collar protein FliF n=1 Tax=Ramlibacter tataouinensis TaxID=94132 RepID=UPI0022F3E6AE|nr:flagellar basal-body MS-ring/collar protein FliF [Ramlibacter tataouinensis]WBY00618.1 flagellar basal-body MS-ring/collar protein FliF [Ramlibacter tataouinensis]
MNNAALAEASVPSPPPSLLAQLRANPRLPLMVAAALAVAALAALWLWSRAPDFRVLYGNVSDRDGGAIMTALQQMNVPYRFAEGGTALMVPAGKVAEVRLRLASQGLPKGGAVGFELMDNQKFGTSQFAEQINYQRALEGELARSINAISAVESARVHLALPKPALFVRDQKKPSASVVLTLHRGRAIDDAQVNAIVHLVSSSVAELSPKSISVVDQHGKLLTSPAAARGLDGSQLKYVQEIEQAYTRRIEAILQPLLGAGNVHAQVAADIDFSIVEATDEKHRPNQEPGSAAVRSQQSSESVQQAGMAAAGVPGALSNQPPATPTAPLTRPPDAPRVEGQLQMSTELAGLAGTRAGNARRDATINYEVDRTLRHVQQAPGAVRRVSVAVVVNHRDTTNAQGKRVTQALAPAELEQIRNLVKEAVGFSAERGDSLNVVNSAFVAESPAPELPLWKQPENVALAKSAGWTLLLALLGLYAWLSVVRPLLRKHLQPAAPAQVAAATAAPALAAGPDPAQEDSAARHADNLQYAREIAGKEPLMVAVLLKNWMAQHER